MATPTPLEPLTDSQQKLLSLLNTLDQTGQTGEIYVGTTEFSQRIIAPLNENLDSENAFPHHLWKDMGNALILAPTAPQEINGFYIGGLGVGYMSHLAMMQAVSYASGSIGLSYGAHSNLVVNQLVLNGNDDQKIKYLPKLASGEHSGALAMSEAGAGSDVLGMYTNAVAEKDGDTYRLNGSKLWITNGLHADTVIVYAKTGGPDSKKLTAFIVEKGMEGFSTGKKINKWGMRGSDTTELFFDDCIIPKENILGKFNEGTKVLMKGLNYERLILSAGALGLAQYVLDTTIAYAAQRHQKKKPLITNQAYAHKIAKMKINLDTATRSTYLIAYQADHEGSLSNEDGAAALYAASDVADDITGQCVTALGGNGYTKDYSVGQAWTDAKLYEIGAGAKDIRLDVVANQISKSYREYSKALEEVTSTPEFQEKFQKRMDLN